jgi:hypothetical protein
VAVPRGVAQSHSTRLTLSRSTCVLDTAWRVCACTATGTFWGGAPQRLRHAAPAGPHPGCRWRPPERRLQRQLLPGARPHGSWRMQRCENLQKVVVAHALCNLSCTECFTLACNMQLMMKAAPG